MKINAGENDGCFYMELAAENMQEAALLTRFGMNRTDEIRSFNTHANSDGSFKLSVVMGKSKRAHSSVPRRK